MAAGSEASINVHDLGTALDEKKSRVQCNYCEKVVSGFHRLKYHLGGIRGNVAPCEKVPANVKELLRDNLIGTKRENVDKELGDSHLPWKRKFSHNSDGINLSKCETTQIAGCVVTDSILENCVTEHVPLSNRTIGLETTINNKEKSDSLLRKAQKAIGRFFYETGIDFSAVNSPSFQIMINATLGVEYKVPSCRELKGWILQDELKEVQEYVTKIKHSWASTGCSILLDGWIDEKGRHLVNFLVDCPQGPIYLRSSDISDYVGDADGLQLLLDGIVEEVGMQNVVQVVAHSTTGWVGAVGKQFMGRRGAVFWTVSASHCIELILEKIRMMDPIRGILDKAKTIAKFIQGHATVLNLLRNHTLGHDLIKLSKIRSAIPFLTLENIVSKKQNLKNMFASSEWNASIWASKTEGKRVSELVADVSFWAGAKMVVRAAIPLVRVLCLINGADKPQVGYIYETMDQAKETIKEEFRNKKSKYMPFWEVIDEIWDTHLHSPLHAAGYYLNPSLFYSSDFYSDPEVALGLLSCIVRLIEDKHSQDLISQQLEEYRHAKGSFAGGSATGRRTNIPPSQWWSLYGGQCPELQRFAIRILSQNCDGASRYGLKRTLAEKFLTKGRNQVDQQLLSDLTFVHYNLQLQHFQSRVKGDIVAEEIDPFDAWEVDEAPEFVPQNGDQTWTDSDSASGDINGEAPCRSQLKKESMEDEEKIKGYS